MTEEKFDPVKEFINLRDNISKAIGQSLKNAAGIAPEFPAVDIYETEEAVIVCTEPLLGVVAASIEVSMEGDNLVIKGETCSQQDVDASTYLRRELRYGPFSRTLSIPRPVDPNKAAASIRQGVLTVALPKLEPPGEQIIDVIPAE